jgi:hypothetical protein
VARRTSGAAGEGAAMLACGSNTAAAACWRHRHAATGDGVAPSTIGSTIGPQTSIECGVCEIGDRVTDDLRMTAAVSSQPSLTISTIPSGATETTPLTAPTRRSAASRLGSAGSLSAGGEADPWHVASVHASAVPFRRSETFRISSVVARAPNRRRADQKIVRHLAEQNRLGDPRRPGWNG